jgi:hypothetical protein
MLKYNIMILWLCLCFKENYGVFLLVNLRIWLRFTFIFDNVSRYKNRKHVINLCYNEDDFDMGTEGTSLQRHMVDVRVMELDKGKEVSTTP